MLRSFRLRITLWYLAFFSLLFVAFGVFLYSILARALRDRLDEALAAESRTAAALFEAELEELQQDAAAAATETVSELRMRGVAIVIVSGQQTLAVSVPTAAADRGALTRLAVSLPPETPVSAAGWGATRGRAFVQRLVLHGREYSVLASSSLESVNASLAVVRHVLVFGLPLLIAAAGLGGFWLAARSLLPLRRMADQARNITAHNLNQRLETGPSTEELATLARTFNELLSRLDTSFETMRRFIADASHELRTPVSVIRGEAQVALGQERSPAAYRESLAVIHDESRRLSRLVDDLLNLARADAGYVRLRIEEFYINDLLTECCRAVGTLAAAKGITVECRAGEDFSFCGDEELLRRMILNLLDNAIRYTPRSGKVVAAIQQSDAGFRLSVSDTGIGIAASAAPHIFERFFRADEARSRREGGFGLGLAIVKWIAESHRGNVRVASAPGTGSTFTVELPTGLPAA